MRFASLASSLLVLLGGIAHAAEGDHLVVTGARVNVRAGPQSEAPVLLQVDRAEPAVEIAREGAWVQVRLPERETAGWIHRSLLGTAGSAAAPSSAGQPATTAAASQGQPSATAAGGAGAGAAPRSESQLAAVGSPTGDALAGFRDNVKYLNTRALAAAGVDLFTDVRLADDDVAQITATDAWKMVPEGGRQSYMNALYDRWLAAVGGPPARLQIVDESGQVLSEKSGP